MSAPRSALLLGPPIRNNGGMTYPDRWERQPAHFVAALGIAVIAGELVPSASPLFYATLGLAFLHQLWVAVWWRLELHGNVISTRIGHPRGFTIYKVGFVAWAFVRVASVWWLAFQEPSGLGLAEPVRLGLAGLCLVLFAALMISVRLTFGIERAFGLDHWDPDACREMGFVRRGLHKLTPNAMYVFAPTVLLVPALYTDSLTATVAALANWAILWAHYWCTEKPDIARIWGEQA